MHESEQRGKLLLNGKPMPEEALARLLGLDKQILTKTLTTLLSYGVAASDPETGALMSRRMVRDENLRAVRQAAGKMGGNPALLKQNASIRDNQKPTTRLKQKSTPSSSPSSSSSIAETATREASPFEPEISGESQQAAASEELAELLSELYAVKNNSGWQLSDKLQSLAIALAGVEADLATIRAFWDHRKKPPQFQYFVQDFVAWRAGQKGATNGSSNGSKPAKTDRWQSGKQI